MPGGTDPVGLKGGSGRVIRGGSWGYSPVYCRSALGNGRDPSNRDNGLGFRVARSQLEQ